MTIYIDSDFKCHATDDGTMTAVETDFFDGKCDAYMEGYRFVPSGAVWTREDGAVFHGEMIAPWKPWPELDAAQLEYELGQIAAYDSALSEIEATIDSPESIGDMTTIVEARKQAIIRRIDDITTALETMEVTPE